MNTKNISTTTLILLLTVFAVFTIAVNEVSAATSPPLGAASTFAVLAATPGITNVPTSAITGDVGLSPASGVAIGLTCVEVTGTIYSVDATGPLPCRVTNPGLLTNAQVANTAAFGALSAGVNAACTTNYGAVTKDLVGLTLVPGVYCANAFQLTTAVPLTLNALGDANAVWIFRTTAAAAALTTTPGVAAKVQFLNGVGSPCNVWWKVASSASIGSGTIFIGNILALTSITLGTGASLDGRALAQTGQITLDSNHISAVCAAGPVLTNITLLPGLANLTVGQTLQLNATCVDQFGLPIAGNVSYQSSNSGVATVNASGLVTAVAAGTATITAICESNNEAVNATSVITVKLPKTIAVMDDKLFILLTASTLMLGLYGFKKYSR